MARQTKAEQQGEMRGLIKNRLDLVGKDKGGVHTLIEMLVEDENGNTTYRAEQKLTRHGAGAG